MTEVTEKTNIDATLKNRTNVIGLSDFLRWVDNVLAGSTTAEGTIGASYLPESLPEAVVNFRPTFNYANTSDAWVDIVREVIAEQGDTPDESPDFGEEASSYEQQIKIRTKKLQANMLAAEKDETWINTDNILSEIQIKELFNILHGSLYVLAENNEFNYDLGRWKSNDLEVADRLLLATVYVLAYQPFSGISFFMWVMARPYYLRLNELTSYYLKGATWTEFTNQKRQYGDPTQETLLQDTRNSLFCLRTRLFYFMELLGDSETENIAEVLADEITLEHQTDFNAERFKQRYQEKLHGMPEADESEIIPVEKIDSQAVSQDNTTIAKTFVATMVEIPDAPELDERTETGDTDEKRDEADH